MLLMLILMQQSQKYFRFVLPAMLVVCRMRYLPAEGEGSEVVETWVLRATFRFGLPSG